jgi:hypothetical protein
LNFKYTRAHLSASPSSPYCAAPLRATGARSYRPPPHLDLLRNKSSTTPPSILLFLARVNTLLHNCRCYTKLSGDRPLHHLLPTPKTSMRCAQLPCSYPVAPHRLKPLGVHHNPIFSHHQCIVQPASSSANSMPPVSPLPPSSAPICLSMSHIPLTYL